MYRMVIAGIEIYSSVLPGSVIVGNGGLESSAEGVLFMYRTLSIDFILWKSGVLTSIIQQTYYNSIVTIR